MPMILPVIAAAGSIYAGVTAIAAGSALIGGLMVAGGALSLVGTMTDNKKLSRIGSVVSLVGGIAGIATGAWSAASETVAADAYGPSSGWGADTLSAQGITEGGGMATEAAYGAGSGWGADTLSAQGLDAAAVDAAANASSAALSSTADGMLGASAALDPVAGVSADNLAALDPAAGAGPAPQGGMQAASADAAPRSMLDPAATQQPGADPAALKMTGEAPAQGAPGSAMSQQTKMPTATAPAKVDPATTAADSFWGKTKNMASDAMKWMEKNPTTTKIGAGMIQGAMQSYQRNQAIEDDFQRQQRERAAYRAQLSQSITGPNGKGLMIPKWRPSAQGG